jgi:alginate export protein
VELKPNRKWTASASYHNYWLASQRDGLYAASGALVARSINGTAGSHVGQEIDAQALCKWNRAVQLGFGYAHLFTGEFLSNTTGGKDYNYPYAMVTYAF